MADERLDRIEQKQSWFEQHFWKMLSTGATMAVIWYLNSINTNFDTLNKEILAIKLNDSANTITINTIKSDVIDLKSVNKEVLGRIGSLEKSNAQHEQQLRQLNK
ncbi:MAG: hypothetical protein ACRCXK_02055 [Wohlfahrtiimonas sp.]